MPPKNNRNKRNKTRNKECNQLLLPEHETKSSETPPVNTNHESSLEKELLVNVTCPLSQKVFKEPVVIVQTGAIVELDWLRKLEATDVPRCPKTFVVLNKPITYSPARDMNNTVGILLDYYPQYGTEQYFPPQVAVASNILTNKEMSEMLSPVTNDANTDLPTDAVLPNQLRMINRENFICISQCGIICCAIIAGITLLAIYTHPACHNFLVNNQTPDTLSYLSKYDPSDSDNYEESRCTLRHKWENVLPQESTGIDKWVYIHCHFSFNAKDAKNVSTVFDLRTKGFGIDITGVDENDCTMSARKTSWKTGCTFDLEKHCPSESNNYGISLVRNLIPLSFLNTDKKVKEVSQASNQQSINLRGSASRLLLK